MFSVENLKTRSHGADVAEFSRKHDLKEQNLLDFSSNVNIFVPEIDLSQLVMNHNLDFQRYPDIYYRKLREDIAYHYDLSYENVIPGNGASEIIYLIMRHPEIKSVGIFQPTFSEYERAAVISGKKIRYLSFALLDKEDAIENQINGLDLVVICNPNNPTGSIYSIEHLIEKANRLNVKVLVDETFIDFQNNKSYSLISKLETYPNLILLKAVTKLYAYPGVRLGYGLSSGIKFLNELWNVKEPWTINALAVSLGHQLFVKFDWKVFEEKTKKYYEGESERLYHLYSQIEGAYPYHTRTNFMLIRLESTINPSQLKNRLALESNLLIRICNDFYGLESNFIRIAIKEKKQNDLLVQSIKGIISTFR